MKINNQLRNFKESLDRLKSLFILFAKFKARYLEYDEIPWSGFWIRGHMVDCIRYKSNECFGHRMHHLYLCVIACLQSVSSPKVLVGFRSHDILKM